MRSTVEQLERARRSQGRVRRKDVVNPYYGVHSGRAPTTLLDRCHTYAVRLRPGQVFSHQTAARLHGIPLPRRLESDVPLHIAVVRPASPPRTDGVAPHRLMRPAVLQPDATRRLLLRRIEATRRAWGPLLCAALVEARSPVLSPGETRVRLLLTRAGIPEPECNGKVFDASGRYLGKPDLVWRARLVGLEYEGAGHADPEQMRFDIARREAFHDAGWDIVQASADDLRGPTERRLLVDRVRRRLALSS